MWRLMNRIRTWATNEVRIRDERGAVLVLVAVGMVMLIGFTAFTVDFGRIYSERRELQNGADAAALAVAQDCAYGDCGSNAERFNTAEEYADKNASDDLASVENIDLDLGAQQVTVYTATEDPGGDNFFDMTFAKVVGYDGLTVRADATVAWGPPAGLSTLPIIFSICEWEKIRTSLHPSSAVLNNELPPTSGYPRVDEYSTVIFHGDEEPCHLRPSGLDLPGGFGWLDANRDCSADIDAGGWVGVSTGIPPPRECGSALPGIVGTVQLIPYFDDVELVGAGARYHVAGFGAMYVTGYTFPSGRSRPHSIAHSGPVCNASESVGCIEGYFIDGWVVDGAPGGGADFGVVSIHFVD